jgi:3-hydroxyacyl-[acyl-carrier-protein] dehydratase
MNEAELATIETFDILRLLKSLPHRYPFLMVDRVIEARGDESGIGIKNVSINEPQFQGHFPERPVMPGVLLIEGIRPTESRRLFISRVSSRPGFESRSCRATGSSFI